MPDILYHHVFLVVPVLRLAETSRSRRRRPAWDMVCGVALVLSVRLETAFGGVRPQRPYKRSCTAFLFGCREEVCVVVQAVQKAVFACDEGLAVFSGICAIFLDAGGVTS